MGFKTFFRTSMHSRCICKKTNFVEQNKIMDKKWVCIEITHRYNKTQHVTTLKKYLKKFFSQQQILFLGNTLDDENFKNVMDGYFFVQCNDLTPYLQSFKQSKYINNVLIDFQQIAYISDQQISQMVLTFNQKNQNRKNMFKLGDVVKVQKGVFKNLYAVVTQVINQKQILGVFKFVSGYRIQRLTVDNCQYKNNFFDVVRVAYK